MGTHTHTRTQTKWMTSPCLTGCLAENQTNTHTDYTQSYITPLGDTSIVPNNPCRPLGGHTDQTKAVAKKKDYMPPLNGLIDSG